MQFAKCRPRDAFIWRHLIKINTIKTIRLNNKGKNEKKNDFCCGHSFKNFGDVATTTKNNLEFLVFKLNLLFH